MCLAEVVTIAWLLQYNISLTIYLHFNLYATRENKTIKKLVTQPNFIIIRALPFLGIGITFRAYFDFDGVTLL
jgi:hypothetical protein